MPIALADLKAGAEARYKSLREAFSEGPYWQCGHSFDTILDYYANVDSKDAASFAKEAVESAVPPPGAWWDDYGWWGIAALRAAQHGGWFPSHVADFKRIASECWEAMHGNAPHVWELRPRPEGKDYFRTLEPRFVGGIWNSNWSRNVDKCKTGSCDPLKPCNGNLCGYQNTVTNTLYWVLASRLYRFTRQPLYLQAADQEYGARPNCCSHGRRVKRRPAAMTQTTKRGSPCSCATCSAPIRATPSCIPTYSGPIPATRASSPRTPSTLSMTRARGWPA